MSSHNPNEAVDIRDPRDPQQLGEKILQYARDGRQSATAAYDNNGSTMEQIPAYNSNETLVTETARQYYEDTKALAATGDASAAQLLARLDAGLSIVGFDPDAEADASRTGKTSAFEDWCAHDMLGQKCRRPKGHTGMHQASSFAPSLSPSGIDLNGDMDPADCG